MVDASAPAPVQHPVAAAAPPRFASLDIDLAAGGRPILGTGFNLEHALWSCASFRPLLRGRLLGPLQPAFIRLDTGLLPAAPSEMPAEALGPAVYRSVLSSEPYADSWALFRRLRRSKGQLLLGVWGGPAQFTRENTRLGQLEPKHYDDYVTYVEALADFIVRRQHARVWAMSIANEPEGNDGNQIPPDGLAYIARQLAPRLARYQVKLYGPDTGSAVSALDYLPGLLSDPVVADALACVAFHRYRASDDVARVVERVQSARLDLPVIVTEYTTFAFGNPDEGVEVNDALGYTLEVLAILLSHLEHGIDAAMYWDAVDYLQPGKGVITRWGLLRGPAESFAPRLWYHGCRQVWPHLQPGARVLPHHVTESSDLQALPVRGVDGRLVLFAINRGFSPLELTIRLERGTPRSSSRFVVVRTDATCSAKRVGWLRLDRDTGLVNLPPRSVTTLLAARGRGQRAAGDGP